MSSFAPRKRLGQHFLADQNILRRIVDALDPAPGDVVLEIGAGAGTLTAVLAPRVAHVIAIERDRRLAAALHGKRATGNVAVVEADALRIDWHALVSSDAFPVARSTFPAFKVIGNIPYNITSPLIEKALTPPLPERVVFLVQEEVADRLAARPGSRAYGALTVGVQALCTVDKLFTVRPGSFRPPPKVGSAVVRFTPRATPLIPPEHAAALRAFVTACFSRRRKQLRNVLTHATGRPAVEVTAGLAALGLDAAARPETVSPGEYVRLLLWRGEL